MAPFFGHTAPHPICDDFFCFTWIRYMQIKIWRKVLYRYYYFEGPLTIFVALNVRMEFGSFQRVVKNVYLAKMLKNRYWC